MINKIDKNQERQRRHARVRKHVAGTADCPRLVVYRSLSNIYAQIIDDTKGVTLCSASTLEKSLGADGERIDKWRKAILTEKYEQTKSLATLLQERFGQAGKAIFFYVQQRLPYAVSKAYVIGQMFIKEEEIGE